jgi:hypothetical protein
VTDRTDDLAGALSQAVTALFGATSLAVEVLLRALADSRPGPQTQRGAGPVAADAADLVLGLGWRLTVLVGQATTGVARVTRPVVGVVIDPPLVPRGLRPVAVMGRLRSGWASERPRAVRTLASWSSTAAPLAAEVTTSLVDVDRVAEVVLSRVDVTGLVAEVVDRLDVEKVAAGVLERVDVDRLLATAIDRIDLQALVERALARLDLNEVVATALDGLDLRPLSRDVVGRLDVDGLAGDALDQIDLTQLVLGRIDMERLVTAALDSLDLTQLVLNRVDLERIVTAALDELDLTQLVMQRVDLPGVADYVVDEIDLPEIIRESTGSMASETIQGVRLQGIEADRAVNRVVDRMLWRRRARRTAAVDLDHAEDRPDSGEEPPDEH